MTQNLRIRSRDRDAIIQSLSAGVVPRRGQQHIQVGRVDEVRALVTDIDRIADGGAAIRLVIGAFGSGKTFFLSLVRAIALERKLVTLHADLSPERRLHSTSGHARSLYSELMRNLSTRSRPDGGGLPGVVETFVSTAVAQAKAGATSPEAVIQVRLEDLSELVGGFDFAQVIEAYWRGHDTGNDELRASAIRWLRGEYSTRTDARKALGVRTIIDDQNVYDHLKLLARFVRHAGYSGLLVCMDELVNLYKLANGRARSSNYEQILRILNDTLQGTVHGMGVLFGGTPEFLTDTRRGLYSYEALQSRLSENRFAIDGLVDLSSPVVRLANLDREDLYVLLLNIRNVFAAGDPDQHLVPDEALRAFMDYCSQRIGDAYFRTPRNTIREFVHLLSVLEQNPAADWRSMLGRVNIESEANPDLEPLPDDVAGDAPVSDARIPDDAKPEDDDSLNSFRL